VLAVVLNQPSCSSLTVGAISWRGASRPAARPSTIYCSRRFGNSPATQSFAYCRTYCTSDPWLAGVGTAILPSAGCLPPRGSSTHTKSAISVLDWAKFGVRRSKITVQYLYSFLAIARPTTAAPCGGGVRSASCQAAGAKGHAGQ